jgi:hypothetical protein
MQKLTLVFLMVITTLIVTYQIYNTTDSIVISESSDLKVNFLIEKIQPHIAYSNITLRQCEEHLISEASSNHLQNKKLILINKFIEKKQLDGILYSEFSKYLELNVKETNELFKKSLNTKNINQYRPMSLKNIRTLLKLAKKSDFYYLANKFRQKEINPAEYIFGQSVFTVLLDKSPYITSSEIEELINSGLEVNLNVLKFATKRVNNIDLIRTLHQNSSINANVTREATIKKTSLANLAISSLNPSAVSYWLETGSPIIINKGQVNGIEYLHIPMDDEKKLLAKEIVTIMFQAGHRDILESTYNIHSKWLTSGELNKFNIVYPDNQKVLEIVGLQKLKEAIKNLDAEISKFLSIEQKCEIEFGLTVYSEELLNQDIHVMEVLSKLEKSNSSDRKRKLIFEKLEQLEQLEQMKQEDLFQMDKLINLSITKNWKDALAISEELTTTNDEESTLAYLNLLLVQAITNSAPFDFIEELLIKGAILQDNTIILLTLTNNLKLIRPLQAYGLNIDYVDDRGKNALSYSVESDLSKNIFHFLLENNINTKPNNKLLDPLNYALKYVEKSSVGVYYANHLINLGVAVNNSHAQQLELLKISFPSRYEAITKLN